MFSNEVSESPKLIETSAKNYLYYTLHQCHQNRVGVYYYALNIGVLVLFLGITAAVLYYCSQRKLTEYDQRQKMMRDQEYVLSKIRFYQEMKDTRQSSQSSGITDLPFTLQ